MKVFIKGKHEISLGRADFLTDGGQADIYVRGETAYKIYKNTSPISEAKIDELQALDFANVIRPEDALLNSRNKLVGYTMKYVKNTIALCSLFPRPFRTRNNITSDTINCLVQQMRETVVKIHDKNILIVDLNELNFLLSESFDRIFFIDVDSYQTPSFAANALMESVRDRHMKNGQFTELTDWFSFGIVTFQMFRGIHPYKGSHDTFHTLDDRMLNNISVLNPSVKYPKKAVLPEDVVPPNYRRWYYEIFEKGARTEPPFDISASQITVVFAPITPPAYTGILKVIDLHQDMPGDTVKIYRSGKHFLTTNSINKYIVFSPKLNVPIHIRHNQNKLSCLILEQKYTLEYEVIEAEQVMESEGQLYFKQYDRMYQVMILEMGNVLKVLKKPLNPVLPHATTLFPGCIIQNILGSFFVTVFSPPDHSFQFNLKELQGFKILSAKYDLGVLMVLATKHGSPTISKFIVKVDLTKGSCCVRVVDDVGHTELNFITLPQGVCISNEVDSIEIFLNDIQKTDLKRIQDTTNILGDIILLKDNSKIVFTKGSKLFQLTTQ